MIVTCPGTTCGERVEVQPTELPAVTVVDATGSTWTGREAHRCAYKEPRSACRGCQAPILWVTTPTGRRIPLDPQPVLALVGQGHVLGRVSHFATCPKANSFRRRGR